MCVEYQRGTYSFAYIQGASELVHFVVGLVALQDRFLVANENDEASIRNCKDLSLTLNMQNQPESNSS